MKKSTKWIVGIGGAAALGGVGYYAYQRHTGHASVANTVTAPSFLSQPAPAQYNYLDTNNSFATAAIGPGSGNQPNGTYTVSAQFTAPVTGTYALEVGADDCAVLVMDGATLGAVDINHSFNLSSHFVTGTIDLSAGTHTLVAQVYNNDLGTRTAVPYGSGTPNPTGFAMTLTAPSGQTVLTTSSAAGWHYSGYVTAASAQPSQATAINVPLLS